MISSFKESTNDQVPIINDEFLSIAFEGFDLITEKESLKKGINFFVEKKLLKSDPSEIVKFIKINLDFIDGHFVGDYLGIFSKNNKYRRTWIR